MRTVSISLIKLYQKTLSPDHSWLRFRYPNGYCRYYPSCSEYTAIAIAESGVIRGSAQGIKRIVRCNPLAEGGVDMSCYNSKGHIHA